MMVIQRGMKHLFANLLSQWNGQNRVHPPVFWRSLGGRLALWSGVLLAVLILSWVILCPRPPLLEGVPFSTVVFDRHQSLMRLSLAQDERYRVYTPLNTISPELIEMTLLYEDQYFFAHPGVNPFALLRAAWGTYVRGDRRLGASTITMQLARLRLGLDTSGVRGKLYQMERALAYERHYSKREILEAYFNIAPYGGNIEGCAAASHIYYHKKPAELNLAEVASLVSVPQNPSRRNPLALRRLLDSGERDKALEEAQERLFSLWVEKHPEDKHASFLGSMRLEPHGPEKLPFIAPHVSTEAVLRFGGPEPVQTTIDFRLQRQVERHVSRMVERQKEKGIHNASALLVHWPSREIRALVGSADFHNKAIEGQVDGTRAKRSPGSTLKPFIYALALEQGLIHPKTVLYDTPKSFGSYDPENADQVFKGPLSAEEALRQSRNIPAISLANQLGEPDLYDFLQAAQVDLPFEKDHYGLALVLGGGDLTMRELAALYAVMPNKGVYSPLILFEQEKKSLLMAPTATGEVETLQAGEGRAQGENVGKGVLDAQGGRGEKQLLSGEAALVTLSMMRAAPFTQPGHVSAMVRRAPMYWKTGTSNGYHDAWTAGVFGPYVLIIWVGNFDNTPNNNFLGISAAAPLFWEVADSLYNMERFGDEPMRDFGKLNIKLVPVCRGTGDIKTTLCPDTIQSYFIPGVSPIADSGVYREILIDKATGRRACLHIPGQTEKVVWEFWPTQLQRVFQQAGIIKPAPPPFLAGCDFDESPWGTPPEILSPKRGVVYHRSLNRPEQTVVILQASGEGDVTEFFWFGGGGLIGRTNPGMELVWTPPAGFSTVRVVDNFGRSSSRVIEVQLTE